MTETSSNSQKSNNDTLQVSSKNAIAWLGVTVACVAAFIVSYTGSSPRGVPIQIMTGISSLFCLFYLLKATVTTSYDPADDPLSVLRNPTFLERFIMIAIASITGSLIVAFYLIKYLGS